MQRARSGSAGHLMENRLPSLCGRQALSLFHFSRLKARWAHRQACLCSQKAFALYEVLLGLLIFAVGIIALGRAVNNCMNASVLSADDARVREILANRMVEIETTPGQPDNAKEFKIDSGFGIIKLVQKAVPQEMKEVDGTELTGIIRVTLTANWTRGRANQSKAIAFYVYRL
jgi:Tfp pilus assembly protein PilV